MAEGPRITVSMMVKNEEELLPQALASIKELADEIVVVDTGSTDRTVEIAEQAGASMFHHPWEGDFAKHRNQTIEYASGDWIFIIDADEELEEGGVELLREAIAADDLDMISLPVFSVAKGGVQESSHNSVRFFRAGLGIHYEGSVHNEIVGKGRMGFVQAPLFHHGYNLTREKMVAKFHRTTDLLRKEITRDPDNPKWPHYLALSFSSEHLHNDTLAYAENSLALCQGDPECEFRWIVNFYLAGYSRLELGDLDGAEELCRRALALNEDYLDAWAVLTSVSFKRGDSEMLAEAAGRYWELYNIYQQDPKRFQLLPLHTLNQRDLVFARMAMDAHRRGEMTEFEQNYSEAKNTAKDPVDTVLSVVNHLQVTSGNIAAISLLGKELAKNSGETRLVEKMVRLQLLDGNSEQAFKAVSKARMSGLEESAARFLEGLIHLMSGEGELARMVFQSLVEEDPDDADAMINLGLALEKLSRIEEAEGAYHAAIDANPEKLEAAINLGNLYMNSDRLADAIAVFEQVSQIDDSLFDIHLILTRLYWNVDEVDKLLGRALHVGRKLGVTDVATVDSAAELSKILEDCADRLLSLQQAKAALMALELAKNLQPDERDLHLHLGRLLFDMQATKQAIVAYEEAARLTPEDWKPFEGLLACYERLGSEDAVQLCRERIAALKKQ